MAKTETTITLRHAVTLGVGEKAKTHGAGSTHKVSYELAAELVQMGAADLCDEATSAGAADAATVGKQD